MALVRLWWVFLFQLVHWQSLEILPLDEMHRDWLLYRCQSQSPRPQQHTHQNVLLSKIKCCFKAVKCKGCCFHALLSHSQTPVWTSTKTDNSPHLFCAIFSPFVCWFYSHILIDLIFDSMFCQWVQHYSNWRQLRQGPIRHQTHITCSHVLQILIISAKTANFTTNDRQLQS